jgi:alcohol dehydrogenase, propanol-preferring
MGNLPKEQNAAVKSGEGHDAKAPVKSVPVQEPGPGQILVRKFITWYPQIGVLI